MNLIIRFGINSQKAFDLRKFKKEILNELSLKETRFIKIKENEVSINFDGISSDLISKYDFYVFLVEDIEAFSFKLDIKNIENKFNIEFVKVEAFIKG